MEGKAGCSGWLRKFLEGVKRCRDSRKEGKTRYMSSNGVWRLVHLTMQSWM